MKCPDLRAVSLGKSRWFERTGAVVAGPPPRGRLFLNRSQATPVHSTDTCTEPSDARGEHCSYKCAELTGSIACRLLRRPGNVQIRGKHPRGKPFNSRGREWCPLSPLSRLSTLSSRETLYCFRPNPGWCLGHPGRPPAPPPAGRWTQIKLFLPDQGWLRG